MNANHPAASISPSHHVMPFLSSPTHSPVPFQVSFAGHTDQHTRQQRECMLRCSSCIALFNSYITILSRGLLHIMLLLAKTVLFAHMLCLGIVSLVHAYERSTAILGGCELGLSCVGSSSPAFPHLQPYRVLLHIAVLAGVSSTKSFLHSYLPMDASLQDICWYFSGLVVVC